jgi:hypothetical protein
VNYDEALKIIRSVCAAHQGNLQDHQVIQQALAIVEHGREAEGMKELPAKKTETE